MNDQIKTLLDNPNLALDDGPSRAELEQLLKEHHQHLAVLPAGAAPVERIRVELDVAETLLGLNRKQEAWDQARAAFDRCLATELWQEAAEACDILFRTELDGSIAALANGVWLAVTYPIRPQTSVTLLHHIVDETPDKSDGGAVAAVAAHYIADLRTEGKDHDSLTFLTSQVLARVAKRHRGIEGEEMINTWVGVLQLNDTDQLLPRLGKMLEVMADGDWWYDRDALRARLPVN
jgi:hypothetical protein